jgi:alanyl-tRNA synthetase
VQTIYQQLLDRPKTVACLLHRREEKIHWWIGCSEDLDLPWKEILPSLFSLIGAKGGGRGRSWQGVGGNPEGVQPFTDALRKAVWDRLRGGTDG